MPTLDDPTMGPMIPCTVCGGVLTGDKDDDPTHPAGAMCGDCHRARAFDDQSWAMGAADHGDDPDSELW